MDRKEINLANFVKNVFWGILGGGIVHSCPIGYAYDSAPQLLISFDFTAQLATA